MLLADIWNEEVTVINGRPYLAANNIENDFPGEIAVNPSYFSPYAYRIFSEVDPDRDWIGLVDTSYEVLKKSMSSNLDASSSAFLPPNWIGIDPTNGEIVVLNNADGLNTNYSYDALRVPWRMALDWKWYGEPRAREILSIMNFLNDEWGEHGSLSTEYSHDGRRLTQAESPAMYGGSLGVLMITDAEQAQAMYENKLQSLYDPDKSSWKTTLSYYDDNWAWFGIALYHDQLSNLWEESKKRTVTKLPPVPLYRL